MFSIERTIRSELKKAGIAPGTYELQMIRGKFGISVFRIKTETGSFVGKYFGKEQLHGRKEIRHYAALNAIDVPTLHTIAQTDRLLLMEDIEASGRYRLATEEDMSDPQSARLIAQWFRQLHSGGKQFDGLAGMDILENAEEALRTEDITNAMLQSNTRENPFWALLTNHAEDLKRSHSRLCSTITYNDFWWDNMAVAADASTAIMFDYNCVHRGYAYRDIRHILSVLSKKAGAAFLDAYGEFSKEEKAFEDVYFPLTRLISAYRMETFPAWAANFSGMLHNGELMRCLEAFLRT